VFPFGEKQNASTWPRLGRLHGRRTKTEAPRRGEESHGLVAVLRNPRVWQTIKRKPRAGVSEDSLFVGHSAPQHFKQNELPLLAPYCTAVHLARWYSDNIGTGGRDDGRYHTKWVESSRLSASLATKLRLTPSTRYDARQAASNSHAVPADFPWPWDRRAHVGEEE
jgi:hypothetical protein